MRGLELRAGVCVCARARQGGLERGGEAMTFSVTPRVHTRFHSMCTCTDASRAHLVRGVSRGSSVVHAKHMRTRARARVHTHTPSPSPVFVFARARTHTHCLENYRRGTGQFCAASVAAGGGR